MKGIICYSHIYRFDGIEFEYNPYIGPAQLKKDGNPRLHQTKAFWAMIERFDKLTDAEKAACKVQGGCVPFETEEA